MTVCAKSIYEEALPDDGLRVLTTNYWPRGISRERAGTYLRVLAPSRPLLRGYKDGAIAWPDYAVAYLAEMQDERPQAEIDRLAAAAREGTVTLMCTCKDDTECHRRLLRDVVLRRMEQPA